METNRYPWRTRRGVRPAPETRAYISELIAEFGPRGAAKELGISRECVIAILADLPVLRGTIAIVHEYRRSREAA